MSLLRGAMALVLVMATGFAASVPGEEPVALEQPGWAIPLQLGAWQGTDAEALDQATTESAGADRVVNRLYAAPDGRTVGLYVASYGQQRPGSSIHSPLHCLPGGGWSVLTDDVLSVAPAGRTEGAIRRLVAVRDRARILVLYWYAIHGRMVASDLLSRLYLLRDSLRVGRNDASLVRLVVVVDGQDDAAADRVGAEFFQDLSPHLTDGPDGVRHAEAHR
jgi:EpsI family protein